MSFYDNEVDRVPETPMTSAVGVAEVTHEVIRDQLSDYQDGSLDEWERQRIEQHLLGCQPCRAYAATLRATREAFGKLPGVPAPERARQRLRQIARE